jgi:outer membrane receptor protein involved in Fe transport
MTKRWRNGDLLSIGLNMFGANNYTYGPGFVTVNAAYQVPINEHLSITGSVDNLFNYNTGTQSAAGVAGAGNATILYGPGPAGTYRYSSTPTVLQSVAPQTFRIQLQYKAAPRI